MKFKSYLYLALPIALISPVVCSAAPTSETITTTESNTSANSNMGYGGVKVTIHSPPSILLKLSFPSVNVLDLKT